MSKSSLFLSFKEKKKLRSLIGGDKQMRNVGQLAAAIGVTYARLSNPLSGYSPCSQEVYHLIKNYLDKFEREII